MKPDLMTTSVIYEERAMDKGQAGGVMVVWRACSGLSMAVLTAATGARTALFVFKVCPLVKTATTVLLLTASWMS